MEWHPIWCFNVAILIDKYIVWIKSTVVNCIVDRYISRPNVHQEHIDDNMVAIVTSSVSAM
jgi:hypothetical protein